MGFGLRPGCPSAEPRLSQGLRAFQDLEVKKQTNKQEPHMSAHPLPKHGDGSSASWAEAGKLSEGQA